MTWQIAVDDADSIIRAYYRSVKTGEQVDLLPNMTEEEKKLLAEKEKEINVPEKQELDKQVEAEVKNGDAITA